jgi:hypothetical protein
MIIIFYWVTQCHDLALLVDIGTSIQMAVVSDALKRFPFVLAGADQTARIDPPLCLGGRRDQDEQPGHPERLQLLPPDCQQAQDGKRAGIDY